MTADCDSLAYDLYLSNVVLNALIVGLQDHVSKRGFPTESRNGSQRHLPARGGFTGVRERETFKDDNAL